MKKFILLFSAFLFFESSGQMTWYVHTNALPSGIYPVEITVSSDNTLFLCATYQLSTGTFVKVLKSTTNGENWTEITSSNLLNGTVFSIHFANNKLYMYGHDPSGGGLWLKSSADAGNTWQNITTGIPDEFLGSALTSNTQGHLYLAGIEENINDMYFYPTIYKSSDAGQSWTKVPMTHRADWELSWGGNVKSLFINPTSFFMDVNNIVYKSTDGGNNWAESLNDNLNPIKIIQNGSSLLLGARDPNNSSFPTQFFSSVDNGVNWTAVPYSGLSEINQLMDMVKTGGPIITLGYANSNHYIHGSQNPVGIDENCLGSKLDVFPNPAQDLIRLRPAGCEALLTDLNSGHTRVSVVDLNGRVIIDQVIESNELDISGLPPAVYAVKMDNGQRNVTSKLVKTD